MTTYTEDDLAAMVKDGTMRADLWEKLHPSTRERCRDLSDLCQQLVGMEGLRVQVVDKDGKVRRFIVGRSTGWKPCHLELYNRRSRGGSPAAPFYQHVTKLARVR